MKIKIASNPYEQKITYSKYDEQTGEYNQITSADSSTSKLLSSDFVKCFFPFKAKDILNQLVDKRLSTNNGNAIRRNNIAVFHYTVNNVNVRCFRLY